MDRRWGLLALTAACTSGPAERTVSQAITQCPDQVVEGADVYALTGMIDWDAYKAGGRDFAFIKSTQGNYNKQTSPAASSFATNWPAAKAAGVLRSPYHFFDPTIDGVTQANYFLDNVTAAGGLEAGNLPPLLDIECPVSSSQSTSTTNGPNCEYAGNSGWVDTATLKQEIFDWLDTVHTATGRTPILYSYVSWFASVGVVDQELASYPLFIASYNACATIPAPWTTATFWQYTSTGTTDGISGGADLDRFFGSAGDLTAFIQGSASPPMSDAGTHDVADAGADAGTTPGGDHAGCGCQGSGSPGSLAVGAALFVIVLRRRKKLPADHQRA